MEIALEHANVGAWDVAEGIYADLAAQQLPLRQPERLELARALCAVGKVIPRHAQQVLAAISLWQRQALSAAEACEFGSTTAYRLSLTLRLTFLDPAWIGSDSRRTGVSVP